jgi:hypothetical protein
MKQNWSKDNNNGSLDLKGPIFLNTKLTTFQHCWAKKKKNTHTHTSWWQNIWWQQYNEHQCWSKEKKNPKAKQVYLWSKVVCFVCHAKISQTMTLHDALLMSSESTQWVGILDLVWDCLNLWCGSYWLLNHFFNEN